MHTHLSWIVFWRQVLIHLKLTSTWLQQTLGTRTLQQHPQGQWWICYRLASLVMVFMVVPLLYKISLQAIWRFPRIPRFFVRLCCGMVPFVDHVLSSWMMFDRNNLKGFNEFNGDQAFWCIYSLQCMQVHHWSLISDWVSHRCLRIEGVSWAVLEFVEGMLRGMIMDKFWNRRV